VIGQSDYKRVYGMIDENKHVLEKRFLDSGYKLKYASIEDVFPKLTQGKSNGKIK
jgi:hypothetical protein